LDARARADLLPHNPHPRPFGLERLLHHAEHVGGQVFQLRLILDAVGECVDHLSRVVCPPEEAPVDELLHQCP
jgi:hypothetical protein